MKETARLVLIVVVVTMIATALLAFVHQLTQPIIQSQKADRYSAQLQQVFASADSIEKKGDQYEIRQGGRVIGHAMLSEIRGYSSILQVLVGVNSDGTVQGVFVMSQQETPGLGTRITEQEFLQQFVSRTNAELALRKNGGMIDGIAGATISSRAFTQAVKNAVETMRVTQVS
jgi:electron transport complex protein RnfG